MDYFAMDVYPNTWDASVYAAPAMYGAGAGGSFMCAATDPNSGDRAPGSLGDALHAVRE